MGHHYLWGSKQLNLAYSTIYGQYTGKTSCLLPVFRPFRIIAFTMKPPLNFCILNFHSGLQLHVYYV